MSAGSQIDYDALAAQHGGSVDYDALAAQHGAVGTAHTEAAGIPKNYGFTAKNMLSNAYEGAKSVVKGAYDVGADLVSNPNWVFGDNSTYEKFIGAPAAEQARKASAAFKQGHYTEAAGHELAGALPLIGPAAAQIGEQAGSGDVGGALAKGTAQVATAPLLMKGARAARAAAAPVMESIAGRAYQSALKPSVTNTPAEVKSMVQTGLQNEIPVSEAGAAKLGDLIQDLNSKIAAEIASRPTATVNKFAVASRLGSTAKRFQTQVNPESDLSAISEAGNEFLRNQPGEIPATEAQALKQGTYTQLKDKSYGELQSATKESQKALARGIKEELNKQFPELADMNAQDSRFYGLDDALERAVNRISNHNLISLGGKIATAGAGTIAGMETGHGVVGAAAGLLMHEILTNPTVQSKLAISLSKAAKVPPAVANARVAAYAGSLSAAANESESADQTSH